MGVGGASLHLPCYCEKEEKETVRAFLCPWENGKLQQKKIHSLGVSETQAAAEKRSTQISSIILPSSNRKQRKYNRKRGFHHWHVECALLESWKM